jgi:Domain of unknown function (DUF4249)
MQKIKLILGCLVSLAFFSCKESYKPDLKSSTSRFLVVEGVLNAGAGPLAPTTVRLSYTSKLDSFGFKPELNAIIIVEGKDNTTHPLVHSGNGFYSSPQLNLIIGNEYRLRIRTNTGKEYLSRYVKARQTPAIDSIGWKRDDEGVKMYVNAHDVSGNTRYYRWDYEETWEIRSFYYAEFIYVKSNNTVRDRTLPEDVSRCWKYDNSSSIAISTSERLQSDIISEATLNFIPNNDEKLCVRYSMLLRQYALDKEGYKFYELMKRNTENLGSIFDAQPSEIIGNIQCVTDPRETVIGYVSASTIEQKRVFVSNASLPGWRLFEYCTEDTVVNHPDSIRAAYSTNNLSPFSAVYSPFTGSIIGYRSSSPPCVDCITRQGINVKPSYW